MIRNPSSPPYLVAALLAMFLPSIAAEPRPTQPMRDSASHDQLSQKLRMAQQKDPIRDLGPAAGKTDEDPTLRNSKRDLIKDSAILCFGGALTLVPKQAVLHMPENLKERFKERAGVKVVPWQEFFQSNRGWIRTLEVSREQAVGEVAIPEEVALAFRNSSSAVIATFKGGPISVLPLKEKPETEGSASITPTAEKPTR